jgi:hypothetical protein
VDFFWLACLQLVICVTKSHKAIRFWADMCDKSHILFLFKYIIFFLQIIKATFYFR